MMEERVNLDGEGWLLCPVCNDFYMHHNNVRVYDRDTEDSDGTQVDVQRTVTVKRVSSSEIPGRRDAIQIGFTCESGHAMILQIMQHKGNTIFEWIERLPDLKFEE